MKLISVETTKLTVRQLADLARTEQVVLTCEGKPLAAVRDLSSSDWESVSLAQNPRFIALIEESRRSQRDLGGKRLSDVRKELGLLPKVRKAAPKKKVRTKK